MRDLKNKKSIKETEQRLHFIEARLFWTGRINRSEIMEHFDVSKPQASKDLTLYQELAENNCYYDKYGRTYRASKDFNPKFIEDDVSNFEALLQIDNGVIGWKPDILRMTNLLRPVDAEIFRTILIAIREKKAIHVLYQAFSKEEPEWRWLTPFELSHDGRRWHIHAFCAKRKKWKDFVIGRILQYGDMKDRDKGLEADKAWDEWHTIVYEPHPSLSDKQKEIIEHEYQMIEGKGTLDVRKPMLFYTLVHLGLDTDGKSEKVQHIVLANKDLRKIAGLEK